jgi:multicomponent Na+:H+ antiporter subunit F
VSTIFLAAAVAEMALAAPLIARLAAGPTICDRIVALNTMAAQATLVVLLFAAFTERTIYLDPALWLASFSYVGTIVWARYLERGLL